MTTQLILSPTPVPKHVLFKVGDTLIYYHRWKRWESPQDQQWFTWLKPEEIEQLAPGDQVWMDVDPLHHNGKVYGCQLVEIISILGTAQTGIRISFDRGFTTVSRDTGSKFAILTNERQVWEWTITHDAARNV